MAMPYLFILASSLLVRSRRFASAGHLMLRVVLCVGSLVASSCSAQHPPPAASPGFDVEHYDLRLRFDPETGRLRGRAAIHVRDPGDADVLPLTLEGLHVDTVLVNGAPVRARVRATGLDIELPRGGMVSVVEVVYGGTPPTGIYAEEYEGQRVVFTDSWPNRARGWFPGVHHPSDPATLSLVLDVPRGFEAVGTGAPSTPDTLGDTVRYRWILNASAPTYAYAFAVSDFSPTVVNAGDTLPIRYYMLAADSADYRQLNRTPEILGYFAGLLGPYAFTQYTTVQVPFDFNGMENASAPFLRAGLFDEGGAEATQVHEAAHQWFGDRVVIADWRDLWISEGMATYLTTLFYEDADGIETARSLWADMAALTPQRLATHTALVPAGPVEPESILTWVPYQKGASVVHLLRLMVGDEAFFRTLREAYARYAGRPLSTEVYLDLFEQNGGVDLDAFADYWVYGTSLPELDVQWAPASRRLSWTIGGDAGTLSGIPFLLQITQGGDVRHVSVLDGQVTLPASAAGEPAVRPVGVPMRVR